jgi:hypothetical protein
VIVVPDREIERALVVVAHPDDVDFYAAGLGWVIITETATLAHRIADALDGTAG